MTDKPVRLAKPSAGQLLTRILEEPGLVASVRSLEPRTLGKLIDHVGLEDAGELVALATTEQLRDVFDDDLWHSERPGVDEAFDPDRFALWIEVMLEAGEDFAADTLVDLPEDLVTMALLRQVLVIDLDALAVEMAERSEPDDLTEKALESCLYQEFDAYRVIARRTDGWDALLQVMLALDRNHHDYLERFLERACQLSANLIEENGGLYRVLTSEETLEADVAADREDRRAQEGFVAPSSAAAFLTLARTTDPRSVLEQPRDPLSRAYFREYAPRPRGGPPAARATAATGGASAGEPGHGADRLLAVLREAEVLKDVRPVALLEGARADAAGAKVTPSLLRRALLELGEDDAGPYGERLKELHYLANVLVAGCSLAGRSFRPFEAAEAVLATCNLGLEHVLGQPAGRGGAQAKRPTPVSVLASTEADKLFRVGWHLLHRDVGLLAGATFERIVTARLDGDPDPPSARELAQTAKVLRSAISSGKPWVARRRLAALGGVLDDRVVTTLGALLDECPWLPAAATAPAGEATGQPSARWFIASATQLGKARELLEALRP